MFGKVKNKEEERSTSMVEHPSAVDRMVDVVVIILCGLVAFCSVIPIWYVLMCSISDGYTLYNDYLGKMVWWPVGKINFDGYAHLFSDLEIVRGYGNTIFYTVATTLLGWFISASAGYAMSRQTKLKKFMITFVMIPMMFGGGMLPTYMIYRSYGFVGSPLALIIPGCTNTMFLVMMMNAFNGVPREMYEAAVIDGAGQWRIFFNIMLPLVGNMSAVIMLNTVVGTWNSWLPARIYIPYDTEWWPLQLFVQRCIDQNTNFLQSSNPDYSRYLIQYAAVIAASLPIIVAFPFFQKRLEKAVVAGGVKE